MLFSVNYTYEFAGLSSNKTIEINGASKEEAVATFLKMRPGVAASDIHDVTLAESKVVNRRASTRKTTPESRYQAAIKDGLPEFVIHNEYVGVDYEQTRNPEAHQKLVKYIKNLQERPKVECHAPPNKLRKAIEEITEVTGLNSADAQSFIRVGKSLTETNSGAEGHDVKYNLPLPNERSLFGLDEALKTNFDHRRQKGHGVPDISRFQINKKSLILLLIKENVVEFKNYEESQ